MGKPDYHVVESSGYDEREGNAVKTVVKGVKEYLDRGEGWKPTGGICVTFAEGFYTAYQAIFRE